MTQANVYIGFAGAKARGSGSGIVLSGGRPEQLNRLSYRKIRAAARAFS